MKKKEFLIVFVAFTIFIFTISILSHIKTSKEYYVNLNKNILFQEAKSLFTNMLNTRSWASSHNGIYIKAHDNIKPNKYLEDNIAYTNKNELLIKINPAWMTRQISEITNQRGNYFFKITNANAINPNNEADEFEKKALKSLEKTNKKFYTQFTANRYDLLGALKAENSCLKCHTKGEKLGDVLGGLRVSIPADNYIKSIQAIEQKASNLYIITIVTSIIFLSLIIYTIISLSNKEKRILLLNKTLERKVKKRTKELRKTNKKLTKISITDFLTKIPNRRFFFEMGEKVFFLAKREKIPFSIICIDIDFFKGVNDSYGHHIGDMILKQIANILKNNIRNSDILARTGGEEFYIALNNTDLKGAINLANNLRLLVEKSAYKNNEDYIYITISAGVATCNSEDSFFSLINRADKALYKAKNSGRNRVISS
ncbi:hypothetical protein CP960_02135 [Malaciobacter halophilus]|uniref:diguanylate cyclase n=1 Tax=Malaciobacter halophilus TaxID=197482 RepID=A0A2N1J5T2_9BACT|nr:diguanylate cyclase [Malaciobacter halophilus]AXH09287.1 diguanylate cyclase (DUF3365 domain) [Malaciobacter halophilus]PKI81921.1 hypothetical protein CP960_02135 [Malaciobacter halophilus]